MVPGRAPRHSARTVTAARVTLQAGRSSRARAPPARPARAGASEEAAGRGRRAQRAGARASAPHMCPKPGRTLPPGRTNALAVSSRMTTNSHFRPCARARPSTAGASAAGGAPGGRARGAHIPSDAPGTLRQCRLRRTARPESAAAARPSAEAARAARGPTCGLCADAAADVPDQAADGVHRRQQRAGRRRLRLDLRARALVSAASGGGRGGRRRGAPPAGTGSRPSAARARWRRRQRGGGACTAPPAG